MPFAVRSLDHLVVNCRDVERTQAWYARVLGMTSINCRDPDGNLIELARYPAP